MPEDLRLDDEKKLRVFEEEVLVSHAVIDRIDIGLSLSDKRGCFMLFNARMQEIIGYTMEEINKQDLCSLLYPDPKDRQEAMDRLSEVTAEKRASDVETTIKTKDGSEKIVSVSTSLINHKGSDMFLSVWRDITGHKRRENKLQDSETRFRRLFETAQDGILILDTETGQIKEVNKFLTDMLGYSREEFLGKQLWEIGAFIDTAKSVAAFKELLAKGYVRYEDLPLETKDGRLIEVEFVSNVYEVGHTKVIQCNIRDITKRSRLREALEDSETRFRRLFETAQDGILLLNADTGCITEVNKFLIDMLGYSRGEFLGKQLWEIGPFIDAVKSKTAFKKLQAEGYVRYENLPLKTKDGRSIQVEFVSNVYQVDHTKVIQCNIRDITKRRQLETERDEFNKKLERLALTDSHTGLYNHRYLKEALEANFNRAVRQCTPLSVLMMDIDYFKSINDAYGHLFGDLVLQQFAQLLSKTVRPYDLVVRYGGEEFIIISPDTGRGEAMILANRILDKVRLYNFGDKTHSIRLKLSLAAVSYPEDNAHKGIGLVDLADRILNKAKESGGNRVFSSLDIARAAETISKNPVINLLKEKIFRLTKRANQSLIESTLAFAKALGLKDFYTGEHVEKTVHYAVRISQKLNFPKDKVELIRQAAMLHDLGKVGISDKILHKKSKLSKEEFEEIKRHPQIGVDIIRSIHSLRPVIPAVMHHHERWDGKGYPHGLKMLQIPLIARIISIADVYQALTSDRPYRKAYSKEKALGIIKKGSGTQFDPDIVNSFCEVLQEDG